MRTTCEAENNDALMALHTLNTVTQPTCLALITHPKEARERRPHQLGIETLSSRLGKCPAAHDAELL